MQSLKELFKIGNGPSSSHTMGPKLITKIFLEKGDFDYIQVILYGSLSMTGRGHLTNDIIKKTIGDIPNDIVFDKKTLDLPHPNTMTLYGYKNNLLVEQMEAYSVGGGDIRIKGQAFDYHKIVYPLTTYKEIEKFCKENNMRIYDYVNMYEDKDFDDYMNIVYLTMKDAIDRGLKDQGILPGTLKIIRKAHKIYSKSDCLDSKRKDLMAYAYAVAEENASGGLIVTAPTCGACGIIPSVLRYTEEANTIEYKTIINALKTAGIIGNIVKHNGSISGAEAGCQAEVGTACAMAAAFYAEALSMPIEKIGRAAEIALEHHLGLTCDPVKGYVQIPCIERNAVAALRAIDSATLASYLEIGENKIDFDLVVATMLATGKDLKEGYRETSEKGLAEKYKVK